MDVEDSLAHFGVKGMHWGSRKAARAEKKRRTSSEDARNASDAHAKVKKSGVHSLSNKELQDMITRMNLEQQFDRLKPASKSKVAARFVADVLVSAGKQEVSKAASKALATQVAKAMAARK